MNNEKEKLLAALNIQSTDSDWLIAEKLVCVALLREGVDVAARVLKEYTRMRDLLVDHDNAELRG